jgi:hypothetical protein
MRPTSPLENPRKLKEKQHKKFFSIGRGYTSIEKNPGKDPPAIVVFCSASTLIQSGSILSCLAAKPFNGFYLFKGPGSFKKKYKICRNVEKYKAYRLVPLTTPLLYHFTVPLTAINNFLHYKIIGARKKLKNQARPLVL